MLYTCARTPCTCSSLTLNSQKLYPPVNNMIDTLIFLAAFIGFPVAQVIVVPVGYIMRHERRHLFDRLNEDLLRSKRWRLQLLPQRKT
ncbi:hypothetical protein PRUPE_3G065800 [Prunus persica]|uniref:Uncharacterized protein n=1 Tax=Prunus persica TaxID=3760 RepID=A0A251PZG3_PRUPE|nr:hypothetical protein PRUPE_3G065800 [Prunus persica]